MKRHIIIFTYSLFAFTFYYCNSTEYDAKKAIPIHETRGLTLSYLLDSLHIKPIAVSDTDTRYIKEYKNIYDDFRFNFDFPKLADGSWMLVGSTYGKPWYVVQVQDGRKNGYDIVADEKTGFVRSIAKYIDDKKNGLFTSYSMGGVKSSVSHYSNNIIDAQYHISPKGSIHKKLIYRNGKLIRIIDYNEQGQMILDDYRYKDSNVNCSYNNGKLVLKIKHDYTRPKETIVVHFDSSEKVLRIDTNRVN